MTDRTMAVECAYCKAVSKGHTFETEDLCFACAELRDKFARATLMGLQASPEFCNKSVDWLAKESYRAANAMMKARKVKYGDE